MLPTQPIFHSISSPCSSSSLSHPWPAQQLWGRCENGCIWEQVWHLFPTAKPQYSASSTQKPLVSPIMLVFVLLTDDSGLLRCLLVELFGLKEAWQPSMCCLGLAGRSTTCMFINWAFWRVRFPWEAETRSQNLVFIWGGHVSAVYSSLVTPAGKSTANACECSMSMLNS